MEKSQDARKDCLGDSSEMIDKGRATFGPLAPLALDGFVEGSILAGTGLTIDMAREALLATLEATSTEAHAPIVLPIGQAIPLEIVIS
jgi:hypothetical protein